MRADVLAGTSVGATVASFPLAIVNDWLQFISLVVAIGAGIVSIYLTYKRVKTEKR